MNENLNFENISWTPSEIQIQELALFPSVDFAIPIECTRTFEWNVESFLPCSCRFRWFVGEGPLFWWRVTWGPAICANENCPLPPADGGCGGEGEPECIFLGPDPDCCIPCPPDNCLPTELEFWYMLATSVTHLCERIRFESCNRAPPTPEKRIRRIQKYLRPALCCDVQEFGAIDEYLDIPLTFACACSGLIDPCFMRIICPEEFTGPIHEPVSLPNNIDPVLLEGEYAHESELDSIAAFSQADIEPIPPKSVLTRFAGALPNILKFKHNFDEANILSAFLRSNNLSLPKELDLQYRKISKSWVKTLQIEDWKIIFECKILEQNSDKFGWTISCNFVVGDKITRLRLGLMTDFRGQLELNFNTKDHSLTAKPDVHVHSKMLHDKIGMFKESWNGGARLKIGI